MWNVMAIVLGLLGLVLIVKAHKDQRAQTRSGHSLLKQPFSLEIGRPEMSLRDVDLGHADLWDKYFRGEGKAIVSRRGMVQEMDVWREGVETCLERLFADSGQDEQPHTLRLDQVNPRLLRILGQRIRSLKGFETSFLALASLEDPRTTLSDLSRLILSTPLLSDKVLKCANSAYFGMRRGVNSVPMAILILGLVNLKNIIYREHLMHLVDFEDPRLKHFFNQLWEHLTFTSVCCAHLAKAFGGVEPSTLFSMGLVHDVGKFVIATSPLVDRSQDQSLAYDMQFSMEDETDLFGINHALVGKLIAQEWKFPQMASLGLEHHHAPGLTDRMFLGLAAPIPRYLTALFVADKLSRVFSGFKGSDSEPLHSSYHDLVDRRLLDQVAQDPAFFRDIKKAQELTLREIGVEEEPPRVDLQTD
jgi:HD-like signal output (HDOD) protein